MKGLGLGSPFRVLLRGDIANGEDATGRREKLFDANSASFRSRGRTTALSDGGQEGTLSQRPVKERLYFEDACILKTL